MRRAEPEAPLEVLSKESAQQGKAIGALTDILSRGYRAQIEAWLERFSVADIAFDVTVLLLPLPLPLPRWLHYTSYGLCGVVLLAVLCVPLVLLLLLTPVVAVFAALVFLGPINDSLYKLSWRRGDEGETDQLLRRKQNGHYPLYTWKSACFSDGVSALQANAFLLPQIVSALPRLWCKAHRIQKRLLRNQQRQRARLEKKIEVEG